MSGAISFSRDLFWTAAGWVYRNVLEGIEDRLPHDQAPRLIQILWQSRESGLEYLKLDDLPINELKLFVKALSDVYASSKQVGSAAFKSPEFFEPFMARIAELLALGEHALEEHEVMGGR